MEQTEDTFVRDVADGIIDAAEVIVALLYADGELMDCMEFPKQTIKLNLAPANYKIVISTEVR